MKRLLLAIVVLCCSLCAIASGQNSSLLQGLKSPASEITELEDLIAKAKATGQTPDPAWTTRIRELIPMVKGHASKVPANLEAFQLDGGFAPGAVIRPTDLTPLEQQIRALEFELSGGLSFQGVDPVTFASLKEQLNALYAQRPENRERNPLDQGNDFCPATLITGVPFSDTGSTDGRANDFSPISPCNNTNAPDVVYEFTPAISQVYNISLMGSSYDTYLYVHTLGSCPGIFSVGCNDDNGANLASYLSLSLTAGQVYYIIVDGYDINSGAYTLNVTSNCEVACQPGDVLECTGEVVAPGHETTDCNGGCNNTMFGGVASFQDILPVQTVCGNTFTHPTADGSFILPDVDAYRLTITEACSIAVTVNSEVGSQVAVLTTTCPWSSLYNSPTWSYACSTVTFVTPCVQPGTYAVLILPPTWSGINSMQQYRARVDLIPCNNCRIDNFLQAPGSTAENTCGEGNDNSLRISQEYTYVVNIPHESDWTFSTCNDDSIWDSYMYLTSECSGGVFAENDNGCGDAGLSTISCLHLSAGNYYLTVEAGPGDVCGPFVLNVFECLGSCCYGDPLYPACDYVSLSDCNALGGAWTYQEPCSAAACYTRPDCGDGEVIFSQLPFVPGEPWDANVSDLNSGYAFYEDYSVSSAIGSIRFWGIFSEGGTCNTNPQNFEITFFDSVNNLTQTYNVTLSATVLPLVYFNDYTLLEYTAEINPPCTITNGWVRVVESTSPSCEFYWSWTVLGNGQFAHVSYNGEGPFESNHELAFCLSAGCVAPDSLTIRMLPDFTDAYSIRWWQPAGLVRAWWSTDPSAVFPATYTELFSLNLPAGSYSNAFFAPDPSPEVIYVLTLDCGAPSPATGLPLNPMFIPQNEVK